MSVSDESNFTVENVSYESSKLLRIIGRLAGDKPNLKLNFFEFTFSRGDTKYTVNGEVTFNVIRPKQLMISTSREEG